MPDAEHVAELRAGADKIDAHSQRFRTGHPLTYGVGRACARVLRWRANDLAAYATPTGRRRSARRWGVTAIFVACLAAAARAAYHWLGWPDLSAPIQFLAFVALAVCMQARGWADGYEARDRSGHGGPPA